MTTTENPAPPRPGTKAALQAALAAMKKDRDFLAEALIKEAQRRGWCSDYEYFVRHTNHQMSEPWLKQRVADINGFCSICGTHHPVRSTSVVGDGPL